MEPTLLLDRRPRDRRRNGAALLALGLLGAAAIGYQATTLGLSESAIAGGLFAIGAMVMGVLRLIFVGGRPVLVTDEGLRTALRPTGHRVVNIPFARVHSMLREKDLLFVATRSRMAVFDGADFVEADAVARLTTAIREGVARQPGGTSLLRDIERRGEYARQLWRHDTPVTRALLTLLGLIFLAELALGALTNPLGLIRLGANVAPLVEAGEWHRLVSANFLHAMVLHIVFNAIALLSLGGVVERLLGAPRFLIVYLVSAIAGAGASTLFSGGLMAVGASTAVFGLLGALAALHLLDRDLPVLFRQSLAWWVFIVVANGALPLLVPFIDSAAHAGGMLGGVLATVVVVRLRPRASQVVAAVLGALTVFALGRALVEARTWSAADDARALHALSGADDAEQLNNLAWFLAVDPEASRPSLEGAEALARRAVALDEANEPAYLDTLATVLHRRGDWRGAVEWAQKALAGRDDEFSATQLARFLAAGEATDVRAALSEDRRSLEVVGAEPEAAVFVVLQADDKVAGLLRVRPQGGRAQGAPPPAGLEVGPAVALPVLADDDLATGAWRWYPAESEVLELP